MTNFSMQLNFYVQRWFGLFAIVMIKVYTQNSMRIEMGLDMCSATEYI